MKPIDFPERNAEFAKDQEEYQTLPAFADDKHVVSCWQLDWKERVKMLVTGRIWLLQLTFGQALQPQLPSVDAPFERGKNDAEV